MLSPECQSALISKITNDSLARSGIGCFIAVPRVGIVGGWGGGWTPSSYLQTLIFDEYRLKISIPGQNFKHFDIWPGDPPPVLLGQFQHWLYPYGNSGRQRVNALATHAGSWVMRWCVSTDFDNTSMPLTLMFPVGRSLSSFFTPSVILLSLLLWILLLMFSFDVHHMCD